MKKPKDEKKEQFTKDFFGVHYNEVNASISENNILYLKKLFAISFLNYIDSILTPLDNFGLKEYKSLSFLEKFYLYLRQEGKEKEFMEFPFPKEDYDTPTFQFVGRNLLDCVRDDIKILVGKKEKYRDYYDIEDKTLALINKEFFEQNQNSIEIKKLLEKKNDFKMPEVNTERKSSYWVKKLIASFTEMPEWIWCLVGNIKESHPFGETHEMRYGNKQFSGGTKVYCYPVKWGDGYENIIVIGKPRFKRNLIRIIIRREYIENFRLKQIYDKRVIEEMTCGGWSGWDNSEESKKEIEQMLEWLVG